MSSDGPAPVGEIRLLGWGHGLRAWWRAAFAPSVFALSIGAAVLVVASGGARVWLLLLVGAALACTLATERLIPYERAWNGGRGDVPRDAVHALINEGSLVASVALLPWLVPLSLGLWPTSWPLLAQFLLAVLIADFGITVAHAASHRFQLLWRLHAVHHSATRMYGMNGWMKHPLHQAIETLAGTFPLVLMGVPATIAWLLGFAVAIQLVLQHANVDMRLGRLVRWWAVAPGHRHHHVASEAGDVNFGLFSLFWDRAMGTYRSPDLPAPRDGEIGLGGRSDYPIGYRGQLIEPFRRL